MNNLAVATMIRLLWNVIDTIDRYHATSVSVNSSSSAGSRAPNRARARTKFRSVHHVFRPDLDVDREVIADSRQPCPLRVAIGASGLLLAREPEIEAYR
jgi:hypothetical protein